MAQEAMDACLRVLKESNKRRFDGSCVRNSILIISHVTFRDCRRAHFFRQPFSKIAVYDSRKPTKISVTEFCDDSLKSSFEKLMKIKIDTYSNKGIVQVTKP